MILPPPWSRMRSPASWAKSKAAVRLTATIGSQCARSNSSTSACRQIPAELTRTSMPPSSATHRSITCAGTPSWVRSAGRKA